MISRSCFTVLSIALLVAACAPVSTPGTTGKKAGTISCDGFIKASSALAVEIGSYTEKPACERQFHPGGEGYVETYQLGAFRRTDGQPGQIWSVIMRVFGDVKGQRAGIDEDTFAGDQNFRRLEDVTPVDLAGNAGTARASTFDAKGIALVCVDAFTNNPDGFHTVVSLCRSTQTRATDSERLSVAQAIAKNDLQWVTP